MFKFIYRKVLERLLKKNAFNVVVRPVESPTTNGRAILVKVDVLGITIINQKFKM